jgi:hypothetical protein
MRSSLIAPRALLLGLVAVIVPTQVATGTDAHLLPVGPTFDVGAPIGNSFAHVLEKMLFVEPNWSVRYYSATETGTTGLSIARAGNGHYRLSIRQARPELGSVVASAFYRKRNLARALTKVKIKSAEAEIPEAVAVALYRLWLSLLRDVSIDEKLNSPYVLSAQILLYARTPEGKTLGGKMPPAGFKFGNLGMVGDIVDDLFKISVGPAKSQKDLFARIEKKAAVLTRN